VQWQGKDSSTHNINLQYTRKSVTFYNRQKVYFAAMQTVKLIPQKLIKT